MEEKAGILVKLESDMKSFMRERNQTALSVVRMLLAAIQNRAIEKKTASLDEEEVFRLIQKQIRQHKDSIEQFKKGNRADLADQEEKELKILEAYLPKQLDQDELRQIVDEAIRTTGATQQSDVGKVMKAVMEQIKGRADGTQVIRLVGERIKK